MSTAAPCADSYQDSDGLKAVSRRDAQNHTRKCMVAAASETDSAASAGLLRLGLKVVSTNPNTKCRASVNFETDGSTLKHRENVLNSEKP